MVRSLHFAIAVFLLAVSSCAAPHFSNAVPTSSPQPVFFQLPATYEKLTADVASYNGNPPKMDAWTMNPEHLFIGIDDPTDLGSLRERCASFTRQPGGIDFLFDKLRDPKTGENEVLEIAEILVFFGQENRAGDTRIVSEKAPLVRDALADEQIVRAIAKFPDAPIQREIVYALDKASPKNDAP